MKARAIRDLLYSWYLKILSNYTRLKARAILREFTNITRSVYVLITLVFIRLSILSKYYSKGYPIFNIALHFFHRRAVVSWSMPWMCFNRLAVWWRHLLILQQTGSLTLILDSKISQKTSKIGITRYSCKGRFVLFDLNSKIICAKLGT